MANITIVDKKCCGGKSVEYSIPQGSTIYEIHILTGASIEQSIELKEQVDALTTCNQIYLSSQISGNLVKNNCAYGEGSTVNVIVQAGMFSSDLSQANADQKAQEYFNANAQKIANIQGSCTEQDCLSCNSYRVSKVSECGEYRFDTECIHGVCTDISSEYFVCTGNCNDDVCVDNCIECSSLCPNGSCPDGFSCVCGTCVPDCTDQPCSFKCQTGECPEGSTCVNGKCKEIKCFSYQELIDGKCVDKPCNPDCEPLEIETNECTRILQVQECVRGGCTLSYCQALITENINEGLSCSTGICRDGLCDDSCIPECPTYPIIRDFGSAGQFGNQASCGTCYTCQQSQKISDCVGAECVDGETIYSDTSDFEDCAWDNIPDKGTCVNGECKLKVRGLTGRIDTIYDSNFNVIAFIPNERVAFAEQNFTNLYFKFTHIVEGSYRIKIKVNNIIKYDSGCTNTSNAAVCTSLNLLQGDEVRLILEACGGFPTTAGISVLVSLNSFC